VGCGTQGEGIRCDGIALPRIFASDRGEVVRWAGFVGSWGRENPLMRRLLGAPLIVLVCLILVVDVRPSMLLCGHSRPPKGFILSDLIGGVAVVTGIVTLWAVLTR
jgi:hypothetical protein